MKCVVEGCLVSLDGKYAMVRGIEHPSQCILLMPRYFFGTQKVLKEPEELFGRIIRERKGIINKFDKCYGRTVYLYCGSFDKLNFVNPLVPDICLKNPSFIPCKILEHLRIESGIFWIGLTGSSLLGKKGDVDLIIYGLREGREFYEFLRENNILKKYNTEEIFGLLKERKQKVLSYTQIYREVQKTLQGKIWDTDVYIRIVPARPFDYIECHKKTSKLGEIEVIGEVISDETNYIYPCSYHIAVKSSSIELPIRTLKIESHRGRFCEYADRGDIILVRGELEKVFCEKTKKHYYQVQLWKNTHYIIPKLKLSVSRHINGGEI